jgi:hypothetical protein
MIKKEWEMISRRKMVSLLGLTAALGFAVPPTDAEAQTSGMERRQERRGGTPAQKQSAQTRAAQTRAAQTRAAQTPAAQTPAAQKQ